MMVNVDSVVERYNAKNPVYGDIIKNLVSSGLYSDFLAPGSKAVDSTVEGNILQYKNGASVENTAVALEVLADGISKAILKQLRDGFAGSFDSAINVNLSASDCVNASISADNNVHAALIKLANEVSILHTTVATVLTSLGFAANVADMETKILAANALVQTSTKIEL